MASWYFNSLQAQHEACEQLRMPDREMAGIMRFDAYDRLPQIKCPVLIVHGDRDIGVPVENACTLKSRIPNAELFVVRGAGHHLEAADPKVVVDRVIAFLKS